MPDKNYMVQLDGFRFFAVAGVMIGHWMTFSFLTKISPLLAGSGVNLFFVLSGFLITQILIKAKVDAKNSTGFILKQFYIRRFLRIFPLYYFVVFAGRILAIPTSESHFIWFITYTTNILCSFNGGNCGWFTHLWSLAVEEQFYIIFPFIVLLIPVKWLMKSFLAITIFAIISKLAIFFVVKNVHTLEWSTYALTPCCFDAFGVGAILAYLKVYSPEKLRLILKKKYIFFFSMLVSVVVYILSLKGHLFSSIVFNRITFSIFCFWIIGMASFGAFKGVFKFIIENKLVIYLGRISYGLYVYHHFMPYFFEKFHLVDAASTLVNTLIYFISTVAIASLSWYLFEKPINNWKKHFNYNGRSNQNVLYTG